MNEDSKYIAVLCGEFDDGYCPLTRAKFWELYHKYQNSLHGIIESKEETVETLLKRSGSVAFKIDEMEKRGIKISGFLDESFPGTLLERLGDKCPPMFYFCGDSSLNRRKYVGYVGSRSINEKDRLWTEKMIDKNAGTQFFVVSGGADGIDSISTSYALANNCRAIEFLADNLDRKIKDVEVLKNILEGKLLLYSANSPYAKNFKGSFVAAAMERNKFIYAQSTGTVVVKSDYEKGGTWAGATEAIKNDWCKVYVWDNKEYAGNQALISRGGTGLDDDGNITEALLSVKKTVSQPEDEQYEQLSLFGMMNSQG